MARVSRHQYSGGRLSAKWYVYWTDHTGRKRRTPGFTSRKLTEQLAAKLERDTERIKAGLIHPHEVGGSAGLAALEEEFRAALLHKGRSDQYTRETCRYLRLVAEACGWELLADLDAAEAERHLAGRLASKSAPLSADGFNHYRSALMAFGNWLVKVKRLLPSNPFTAIGRRNPEAARVHIRRALTDAEFGKLLKAAAKGRVTFGLSGRERECLYLVAAYSGLRASALAALTSQSFRLDSTPPVVLSRARRQKNRRAHEIPLPPFVAAKLRPFLKRKVGPLWPGNWSDYDSSEMIRRDLAAAKLEYETEAGVFDFHALRHQYATMLVASGALPAEVQQLLDHSSPALSARYFRHLKTERLAEPVNRMPEPG